MKKILKWLSLGCLLVLLGCRADEMLNQAQQKDEMAKKFKVFFKNTDNQEVNYAEGFRYLTLRYDSLYQTNISGREPIDKLLKNTTLSELNTGTLAQTSYIDFNIRSQLITHENGNKWILFPKIVNKEVVDLAVAILTENETRFGIYILDSNSKLYMDNIDAFRKAYNQHYKSLSKKNQFFLTPMKICGQPGDECDIDEVIIIVPPPSKPFPPMGFFPPDYGGGFPECGTYVDCIPPFYGGSMPRNPINPPKNPCESMKNNFQKPSFKDNFERLQKKETLDLDHELGFAESYENSTPTLLTNRAGTTSVRLPEDGRSYYGFMHTHNNKEGVVRIFSPADVATFLSSCVRNAEEKGNASDAYAIVVTSEGSYTLKYTGDGNYSLGLNQLSQWNTWYRKNYSNLIENDQFIQPNVERVFTQFLKEVVRIEGLEVYKSTPTSSEKMEYNGENQPVKTTPCN